MADESPSVPPSASERNHGGRARSRTDPCPACGQPPQASARQLRAWPSRSFGWTMQQAFETTLQRVSLDQLVQTDDARGIASRALNPSAHRGRKRAGRSVGGTKDAKAQRDALSHVWPCGCDAPQAILVPLKSCSQAAPRDRTTSAPRPRARAPHPPSSTMIRTLCVLGGMFCVPL